MIEVENLTKRFGDVKAVRDVSFEVEKGRILGFLGPNGAGKTTTMRILAGFFPASAGRARIAGFDVFDESLEARKRVGYLPENPPLYGEMTVDSFLKFAATIHAVKSRDISLRLGYVKERCGLNDCGNRLIKHLSKGYKQRVGLAQALIHDPDVLILDEPTVGLDPNQIREVRELIKSLRGDHTIILSTHILPEVDMTCEQVIIIHKGKIVAKNTPENLARELSGGEIVEVQIMPNPHGMTVPSLVGLLGAHAGVRQAEYGVLENGLNQIIIESDGTEDLRPSIAFSVIDAGFELFQLERKTKTLEDVFADLTLDDSSSVEGQTEEEVA